MLHNELKNCNALAMRELLVREKMNGLHHCKDKNTLFCDFGVTFVAKQGNWHTGRELPVNIDSFSQEQYSLKSKIRGADTNCKQDISSKLPIY